MNKYSKVIGVLVIMFAVAGVGFGSVFGYGGSGGSETVTLTAPNDWTVVSPPTRLSAFNYNSADIPSILTYDASTGSFIVPSGSDLLEPVNAFYMLPKKSTAVTFVWDDTPGIASKDLSTGWNLVGTNTSGETIDEFSSIQTSATTVYTPGTRNGRKSITGLSWGSNSDRDIDKTNWTSDLFNPRDGYWIYVTSPVNYSKILK